MMQASSGHEGLLCLFSLCMSRNWWCILTLILLPCHLISFHFHNGTSWGEIKKMIYLTFMATSKCFRWDKRLKAVVCTSKRMVLFLELTKQTQKKSIGSLTLYFMHNGWDKVKTKRKKMKTWWWVAAFAVISTLQASTAEVTQENPCNAYTIANAFVDLWNFYVKTGHSHDDDIQWGVRKA